MENISIDTLITYHKSEAAEELTYVTIIFTVILGLMGYIGSVKKIEKPVRFAIAAIFAGFFYMFFSSLVGSMKIHDALHLEIQNYAETHPELFLKGEGSVLRTVLIEHMKTHNDNGILWAGIILGVAVIFGILCIGEGQVFSLKIFKSAKQKYK